MVPASPSFSPDAELPPGESVVAEVVPPEGADVAAVLPPPKDLAPALVEPSGDVDELASMPLPLESTQPALEERLASSKKQEERNGLPGEGPIN